MAEASKTLLVEKRERTVTEWVDVPYYMLKLNEEEAVTLGAVLGLIAGSEETSYRVHTTSVLRALEKAGIDWYPARKRFSGQLDAKEKVSV